MVFGGNHDHRAGAAHTRSCVDPVFPQLFYSILDDKNLYARDFFVNGFFGRSSCPFFKRPVRCKRAKQIV